MEKETQISAVVSRTTKELLERDIIVHPKLVVSRKTGEAMLGEMARGKPTKALVDLMRDGDWSAPRG